MIAQKIVKITNHGMIIIPSHIRKKYGLKDGDRVLIVDDEEDGFIKIYPIVPIEKIRENSFTTEEMLNQLKQDRKEELEREK